MANPSTETTQKRSGSYSLYCSGYTEGMMWTLPADLTELYLRVGVYPNSLQTGTSNDGIIHFRNSDGEPMFRLHVAGTGLINAQTATTGSVSTIATSTSPLKLSLWSCLEMWLVLGNAGECEVKLNGETILDFSGDTLATETPASIRQICLGALPATLFGLAQCYYDDLAVNDTAGAVNNSWVGRGGIVALVPNAAGDSTQWAASAGSNYQCVDEIPPTDDTDYVYDDTVDQLDLYNLTDNSAVGDVQAICVWARAKSNTPGSGNLALVVKSGATTSAGPDEGLDVSYAYESRIIELNPDDSAAWEDADLDALQAGVKVR